MKLLLILGATLGLLTACMESTGENTGLVKDKNCQKVLGNWVGPGFRVHIYHKDERFYLEHNESVNGWGLCENGNISIPLSQILYDEGRDVVTIEGKPFVRVQ